MENSAGKVFLNRFRVDELLYSTETSSRYRGYDLKRGLPLLIKVFEYLIDADDSVLCFQQKNLTLQTIQHPNVIPYYGLYDDQGRSFLIEKYVEGPTLAQILRQYGGKPIPPLEALIYLKALATALEYMHGFGLVHATIDSSNIQAGRDGTIMLGNFGFARFIDKPMSNTGVFGPPLCQAPEQLRGERVYPTTDIYSLGILFYEFVTGMHPFLGIPTSTTGINQSFADRLRDAHLYQDPPELSQFNPTLPSGLSQTVLTALAKDPKQRYQSAQEMLEICSAVLGSSPAQIPTRLGGRAAGEASAATQVMQKPPQSSTERYVPPAVAATAVVRQSDPLHPGGTQVVPGQAWPAAQPAYPPPPPPPDSQEFYEPEKPARPAWLLPMIGLLVLALLLCGAVGVWASLPLLQEFLGSASATPTATLTHTPTATLELPSPTLPPAATQPPVVIPPTEPPPPPTDIPTETATLPPPPTDTPEKTAFTVTIRNNESYPIYAFRNGTLMGTDPIPPGRYIWYLNIPAGQYLFRFCLDNSQVQCPVEKQVMVDDDITINVP